MIPKDIIQTIIDTVRIEEVVSDFVSLKKRGTNYVGLCPFHNEKTPSFSVSASKGIYKCFGCGKAGNAVNFVMEHEHYTYPEALRFLAGKYNIEIEEQEPSPEYLEEQNERDSLYNLNEFAKTYFTDCLNNHSEGKAIALTYLHEREFTEEVILKFQLGYCPEAWSDFTNHALKNAYNIKYLIKSGLTVQRESGDHYDRFRGRIIFPVHNLTGRVLGFGARIIKTEPNKPKYVNSPETEIYQKSKILYGLYFAKNAILANDNCFLVEGYTDVISLHQAGIQNVVASSGTSLTIDQIRLIKRYTRNITILFDGDEAGLRASFRGIDLILEQGMNVKIVIFPEGEDPDSFARNNRPAVLKTFLAEKATDFIRLKTSLLFGEVKGDPVKLAGLIKEVVSSISLIPDIITRSLYLRECSAILKMEEATLLAELNRLLRERSKAKSGVSTEEPYSPAPPPVGQTQLVIHQHTSAYQETEIIRLLLLYGADEIQFEHENDSGFIEYSSVKVAEFIINDLVQDEISFEKEPYQQIFNEIADSLSKNNVVPEKNYFTSHPDKEISSLAVELMSTQHELSENWEKNKIYVNSEAQHLKQAVTASILTLKAKRINQMLKNIQQEFQNSSSEEEVIELLKKIRNLKETLVGINKSLGRVISP